MKCTICSRLDFTEFWRVKYRLRKNHLERGKPLETFKNVICTFQFLKSWMERRQPAGCSISIFKLRNKKMVIEYCPRMLHRFGRFDSFVFFPQTNSFSKLMIEVKLTAVHSNRGQSISIYLPLNRIAGMFRCKQGWLRSQNVTIEHVNVNLHQVDDINK